MLRHFRKPLWVLFALCLLSASTVAGGNSALGQGADADNAAEASDEPLTYPENEEPNEVPGDNSIKPQPVPPEQKQALQRRAGEQVGDTPRGRAVVLGMYIQEAANERAIVVKVAPTSPAFEAGIRKGDQIVSFAGFKATKYREWIDGMRRLATEAPDGRMLPIVVVRDNKRLNLRLRVPVAAAGAPPASEVNQTAIPSEGGQPAVESAGQQPVPHGGGYGGARGGDTLIANSLVNGSHNPDDNVGRAIAEIVRLNVPQPAVPVANTGPPSDPAPPVTERARRAGGEGLEDAAHLGFAGFRDDANGMFVLLDIEGLLPGDYLVGIDDPAKLSSGGTTGGDLPNQPPMNPNDRPAQSNPTRADNVPQQSPSATPGPPNDKVPVAQPPTLSQQPETPASAASGAANLADPSQNPSVVNDPSAQAGGGVGTTMQIGTLTVDQNGAGRLQLLVESLRVQDVLEHAIVIYSQSDDQQTAAQPNADASAPLDETGTGQPPASGAETAQPSDNRGVVAGTESQPGAQNAAPREEHTTANGVDGLSRYLPVAGGVIRAMSDRGPDSTPSTTAEQEVPNSQSPAAPQNSAAPPGADQTKIR
jgi:hypothetical protein